MKGMGAVNLKWVESEGGPVIVVEGSLRRLWGGCTNSDYVRSKGYAGLVALDDSTCVSRT